MCNQARGSQGMTGGSDTSALAINGLSAKGSRARAPIPIIPANTIKEADVPIRVSLVDTADALQIAQALFSATGWLKSSIYRGIA
jgi:hypothetical protein